MSRTVADIFQQYQQSRSQFVTSIAELTQRPQNIDLLINQYSIVSILSQLLYDPVSSIQQQAGLSIGRLASYNHAIATVIVDNGILDQIAYNLSTQNTYYKKIICFIVKNVAKHSNELALKCMQTTGLVDSIIQSCLSDFDPLVRESAVQSLSAIIQHSTANDSTLIQYCIDSGIVQPLLLCLNEPELSLKRCTLVCINELIKSSSDVCVLLLDNNLLDALQSYIVHTDSKVKRTTYLILSNICKYNVQLCELVVSTLIREVPQQANLLSRVLLAVKGETDVVTRKNGCILLREICKHTGELCQLIVNNGGHVILIQYLNDLLAATAAGGSSENTQALGNTARSVLGKSATLQVDKEEKQSTSIQNTLPAVMCLGYISAFNELLATAIIVKNGLQVLKGILSVQCDDYIKCAVVWTIGQLSKHTSEHVEIVCKSDLVVLLTGLLGDRTERGDKGTNIDLYNKTVQTIGIIVNKCLYLPGLNVLLANDVVVYSNRAILLSMLQQYVKLLHNNPANLKAFVQSKNLLKIQEISSWYQSNDTDAEYKQKLVEVISAINALYPTEIVQFYSPNYAETLLNRLDAQIAV